MLKTYRMMRQMFVSNRTRSRSCAPAVPLEFIAVATAVGWLGEMHPQVVQGTQSAGDAHFYLN